MPRTAASRLPAWLVGSGVIAVGMAVMNLANYAFTMVAARVLGPSQYGAFAAVMGVLLVETVLSLGLQATAARRVAASPGDVGQIESAILRLGGLSAIGLALLTLLCTPLIDHALHLDGWALSLFLAVTVAPTTAMGAQAGVLQGERRWGALAMVYLSAGLSRIVLGAAALALRGDATGAMAGVALAAFLPTMVGWYALRRRPRTPSATPHVPLAGVVRELVHNSHSLLAFFALSNADVVIARTVLTDHQAGLYAGGLILTKAVLFLPQFVVVVAFPSMSGPRPSRRTHLYGLGVVALIGLVATTAVLTLASLAVTFIGGGQYAALEGRLWAFATLGTLLAAIQVLVYSVLAKQHQRMVFVIWAALATLLGAALAIGSLPALLTTVVAVDSSLLVVLVAWMLLSGRRVRAEESVGGLVPAGPGAD